MQTYFIPHKLKVGDITNLSDKDSEFVISEKILKVEDPIRVKNLEAIFWGLVTNINKNSVELQIVEKIENIKSSEDNFSVTIIQSILADNKFNFFLEKAVEIGVNKIIPVESRYSLIPKKKAIKKLGMYKKVIKEAKEQSRNPNEIIIEKPINIKKMEKFESKNKICLATEIKDAPSLKKILSSKNVDGNYIIAIGPERGWSVSDIKIFENFDFEFAKISGNILRAETAALVVSSILNFRAGKY